MSNYDVTKENINEHNPNQPQIHDHTKHWGSGSVKTNELLNLIKKARWWW